ncbi:hypothetical protein PDESU_03195 [Pontiella desulfatans]|uniref:Uncharacterized protein n=1 Tax=Pontiella desulfatans TaxID=2750659 RepID=A0A6C2U3P1_PONDE|nr:hypothetical protein [Pontiella desulfatans]VGO14630.1 hypothetical protein PDESU_03195 [Pontiella desulfatans]
MSQTNVRTGQIPYRCATDLSAAKDRLVKLTTTGMALPQYDDLPHYLVLEGAAAGETGSFLPLSPLQNVRIQLEGTCSPGNTLILSNTSFGAVKVVDTEEDWTEVGIAEEAGVDGQLVLMRPISPRYGTI